ncbi:zinc-finger domain-containing protein [Brevibacillus borstelensis]|uniref:zinc-finger domain-containing protein n=1 Tax=Brevibacillus borstelensis TaxID=45462 RepID=UPI000F07F975|nr:zinc-finger domain-containing protein [Brevibacillus borstelensis]MED1881085.1 zinc-finger domain-containing protein [Brevibacillus borstelensis]RNB66384.1 zinc-finger domain-containing protein [Brevibacillus borstelensis]GED53520.1 hypothetical protein BBO01nite_27610 [Brevibacillus borstelensis]
MTVLTTGERKKKKETRIAINNYIDRYCVDCKKITENRKKYGQYKAQELCNTDCEIGKKLLTLGKALLSGRSITEDDIEPLKEDTEVNQEGCETVDELTRGKYLELSGTMPDYKIANQYNISTQTLNRRKKEWAIEDRRLSPAKPTDLDKRKAKGRPGRPRVKPADDSPEMPLVKNPAEQPPSAQPIEDVEKVSELERKLDVKENEINRLKAENAELRDMYEQQTKEIQAANLHSFSLFLQGALRFSITTKNEDAADTARRTLQKLGTDLDYRVRSGVIEVTTEVDSTPTTLAAIQEDDSHARTRVENRSSNEHGFSSSGEWPGYGPDRPKAEYS